MNDKVVPLHGFTTLDLPPERVLDGAKEANLAGVVIIGVEPDGKEYLASSWGDSAAILWHLKRAEHVLMRMADEQE